MTKASIQSITSWMDQSTQSPLLISGPCSVESPEQVLVTAQQLKAHTPISLLRGGVWKPRTKPGSFEGVGAEAMQWLIDAGRAINTPVTTEVANAQHVEIALKAGVDVLWIGARTTVNPFYVQEIAEALRGVDIPVLVKNPIHAEIGLWAGAIERFRNLGISHIAAVHREDSFLPPKVCTAMLQIGSTVLIYARYCRILKSSVTPVISLATAP